MRIRLVRHGGFFLLAVISVLQISPGKTRGPWRADDDNTPGWALMTPGEERIEHQAKVRGFTNYEDCRAYQIAHHRLIEVLLGRSNAICLPRQEDTTFVLLRPAPESDIN